ncbi:MAG: hypothetical protein WA957_02445 [Alteraurantiacibacter sp.]
MKRKKLNDGQIVGVLKEAEAGAKTADLARQTGEERLMRQLQRSDAR